VICGPTCYVMRPPDLVSPWKEFLEGLDSLLDEPFSLNCIGGFAVVMGYGLPRATNDLDYRTLIPYNRINDLQRMAGPGSGLAKKHKVYLQRPGVDVLPESYEERIHELFPGHFKNLPFVPDADDLVLSKITRNAPRDRQDVEYLVKTESLDCAILRERFEKELKLNLIGPPDHHGRTLEFWIEAYFLKASTTNWLGRTCPRSCSDLSRSAP
jgi:Nucleotidyltransferase of unknown function (DUF6036)